jgi:membrane protein implicated in regulation of membrane protease activity
MNSEFSPWLIWFLAGVAVMLTELAVPGFVIIFFGLGCWGAAALAFIAPGAHTAQLAVFLIVSLASLVTLRKVAMRIFVGRSESRKSEDMGNVPIGARINLDQDLEPGHTGRVHFRGTMWDAVSEDRLPAGSEAEIIGMDRSKGSCLKLKRVPRT